MKVYTNQLTIQLYMLISLSDQAPLSQLNPKKKIFETIQPGLLSIRLSPTDLKSLIALTLVRFRNSRDQGSCVDQPPDEERA
jgi:hypothetical protein